MLSCDVFQDELSLLAGGVTPWVTQEVLEMGLHDRPDELRHEVQAAVTRLESVPGVEAVVLVYGVCGNGLIGVRAGRVPLVMARAHDCVSILLGGADCHEALLKENPAVYFYSPGWIRGKRVPGPDREMHLRQFYAERHAEDQELVDDLVEADRETFARHNCAAYVDITDDRAAESYCRGCAQSLDWKFRRLSGDAILLRDLLGGNWDDARFLVVPPGLAITSSYNGGLITASESAPD